MGKVSTEPQYLSQQEFDTKLDTEIGNLIDKGFSDDDILLYTEDFKSRFAVKKKSSGLSEQEPSSALPSETGSLVSQKPKYPKIDTGSADKFQELINKAPLGVGGVESNAFKEWESIRNEYLSRPPMQADNTDLLRRLEGLQPAPKSALDLKVSTVRELRTKMEEKKLRADVIARATGKSRDEILSGDQDYKQLEKAEVNLKGNDFVSVFGSNLFNASAGIAGTPNAIIESLGKLFVSDEEYAKIPEGMRNTFFTDILQTMPLPNMQAIARTAESGRERQIDLLDESKKLRELSTQYETSITEDFGNVDLAQAGKRLAVEGVGSIPSLVQAIIPYVGLSSIVTGTAANRLEENKLDGDLTNRDVADAWINGAAEGALEAVTRGLAKKAFNAFGNAGEESAKTLAKSIVDNLVYSPLKEGGSEAATSLVQNLSDAFVLGNEVDVKDAMYEIFDSFLIGGVVGGGLGSVTTLGEAINTNRKAIEGDKEAQQQLENKPKFEGEMVELNIPAVEEPVTTTEQQQTAVEQQVETPQQQTTVSEETMEFAEELGTPEDISDVVNGGVSIPIGNTNVVLKSEGENIKIESIQTPSDQRGQGSARQAIQRVTEIADQQGKTLELNVLPMDENTDAQQLVDFYESEGFLKDEGFTLDGGRMTRQPNLQDNSLNLQDETTAEQVSEPVPQGEDRGAIEGNRRMEELTQRFEQNIAASETLGEEGRTNGERILPKQEINDREARESVDWAKENNIWYNDVTDFGNRYSEGVENTVSIDPENNYVYKQNNLIYSGNSISTLFSQVEAFNEVFPSTAYEFVGFSGVDSSNPNRPPTAQPIFRQPLINNADLASPQEIKTYMESLGFEQINETTFSNGTYEVSDLFPRNVLKSQNGETFVVDAIVKRTEQAETTTQEQPITNVDIKTPSGLDRAISYLESLENDLDNFGRETLGMNMPVAIAKAAITTMKASLQTVNSMAEAIKAGVDYIKSTDWYKNLNDTDKSNVQDFFEREVLKVPRQESRQRQAQPFQQREGKKSEPSRKRVTERAVKSENLNQEVKDILNKLEINNDTENQNLAVENAEKIISTIGIEKAYENTKNGNIRGGAKTWIQSKMVESINEKLDKAVEKNDIDTIESLSNELAEIIEYWADESKLKGQELAMLDKVYSKSNIKYNYEFARKTWKKQFGEEPSPEVSARLKAQEKIIKDLEKSVKSLEEKLGNKDEIEAFKNIKESYERSLKTPSKSSLRKAATALRKAKFTQNLSDLTTLKSTPIGVITGIYDGAIEVIATALDSGATISEALQKGINYIKNHKSGWYRGLSKNSRKKAIESLKSHAEPIIQKNISIETDEDVEQGDIKIPQSLLYQLMATGNINDINQLSEKVREILSEQYPNLTLREVRDSITKYGKQKNETSDIIKRKINKLKIDGRQLSALEDLEEGKRPKRSGFKRPPYTPEQRNRIKKIKELLKTLPIEDKADREAFYKTAIENYKTRVQNRISDLQEAIDKNERIIKEKGSLKLDDETKDLVKRRDLLQKQYNEKFGKTPKSNETLVNEILARKENYLNNLLEQLEFIQLNKKEPTKPTKRITNDPRIDLLNKRIDEAKSDLSDLLDEIGIAEVKRIERAKKYISNRIEHYQERLKNKDFSKPKPRGLTDNREIAIARKKLLDAKNKFESEFEKREKQKRNIFEKSFDFLFEALNVPKGLLASIDFSAMFRQGILLGSSNPKEFAIATKRMHQFINQTNYELFMSEIENADDYMLMTESGLSITDTSGDVMRSEEYFLSNLTKTELKIKGIDVNVIGKGQKISERAYSGFLNSLRVDVFRKGVEVLRSQGITPTNDPKAYKALARTINNATGRGQLTSDKSVNKFLNVVFFSPRMITGMFGTLRDTYRKDSTPYARKMAMKSLGTFIAYQAIIKLLLTASYGLVQSLFIDDDDKEEIEALNLDPTDTDFNKLKIGNTRYDTSAGWGIMVRTVARFITETSTNESGTKDLNKGYKSSVWDEPINYFKNKLSPSARFFYNWKADKHPTDIYKDRSEATVYDYFEALFVPLSISSIIEDVDNETPVAKSIFNFIMNMYGINSITYTSNAIKKDRMTKEEAEKIRIQNARKREQQRRNQTP